MTSCRGSPLPSVSRSAFPSELPNPSAIRRAKEPAIMVREPDATMQATPQNNQLMSKHRVLGFKP
jgi:hypothetical protein